MHANFERLFEEPKESLASSRHTVWLLVGVYILFQLLNGFLVPLYQAKDCIWFVKFLFSTLIPFVIVTAALKTWSWNEIGFAWPTKADGWINFAALCFGLGLLIMIVDAFLVFRVFPKTSQYADYSAALAKLLDWRLPKSALVVYMSLSAGFFEEVIYKGILPRIIPQDFSFTKLVLLISLVFSIVHWEQGVSGIIQAFFLSVGTFLLYRRMGNLLPVIFGHVLVDLFLLSYL